MLAQADQRRLRKEIRSREEKIVEGLIKNSDVICTTNVGAASRVLQRMYGTGAGQCRQSR